MRKSDICGRYGGDEFLLILPDTDIKQAMIAADELRSKITKTALEINGIEIYITTSSGVSSLVDNAFFIEQKLEIEKLKSIYEIKDSANTSWNIIDAVKKQVGGLLFIMADEAMYKAKSRICTSCGYTALNKRKFDGDMCPECRSTEIKAGKNRVEAFI